MRIGISTASFFTKISTEDTFDYIKNMGAKVCEVFLSTYSEYEGSVADKIVENRNLDVHSIHALTNQYEPELFSLNPRACGDAERVLRKVMSVGKRLGAKYYTFHGATRLKQIKYNFDYNRLSQVVNNIIDICNEYGIELCYENVHWAYYKEPEYFKTISDKCPNLKATLDIKQAMQAGVSYKEYLPAIKGKLATVHICDYDSEGKLFIPGQGTFDFCDMFKNLEDIGFDGAVLMEVYPQGYSDFNELSGSYNYLLECAEKANIKLSN